MSDPRFTRLRTDPRFRRPRKQQSKVVVDDRFKEIFNDGKKKGKKGKTGGRVDKYGRLLSDTLEADNLRRFYRMEIDGEEVAEPKTVTDYARGEATLGSSDEDTDDPEGDESGQDDIVTFGLDHSRPIPVQEDDGDAEVDLDERSFADLDAQAVAYNHTFPQEERVPVEIVPTHRLAVVNLDWDHIRAIHLYKIFSSVVSSSSTPTSVHPDRQRSIKNTPSNAVRGKVLRVSVYPSQFGKERLAREEKEGPPPEIFKKKEFDDGEEVNEKTIYEVGNGEEYDEDALRKYQLERLRYYYAIVTCDSVETASHIYSELEGTELERSANVFDLSFVPHDMTFDDDCRDEANEDLNTAYKGIDFVTDALRHSKVKLTWDEDDPERNQVTRRALSRQEIEEADFRTYLASSGSDSEDDAKAKGNGAATKAASRDKLRTLLLGGGDDGLPEGWGEDRDNDNGDVDMEITFMPGLSEAKDKDEETTLEKYQRKMKEKRKNGKKKKTLETEKTGPVGGYKDDFFAANSNSDGEASLETLKKINRKNGLEISLDTSRSLTTPEEFALLAAPDNPNVEPKHFNLKSVLKAEKSKGKNRKGKWKAEQEQDLQEDFAINVKDDRFKAIHEDHAFAIDPSNPHFKKTKSMAALLEERSKRRKEQDTSDMDIGNVRKTSANGERNLQSLVESVKRKNAAVSERYRGKRRKV